jgi:outer membrane receptor protein involved in Fe transport
MITAALGLILAVPPSVDAVPSPTPSPQPGFAESVTVVATRFELPANDAPGSVAIVPPDALALSPSPAIDDTLRQVPGFALFRRSGSRTANPTSQGVSLRAVGASGASRAAVIWDGLPLTDPFGGWVYWSRVPRAAVDHVEMLRGGGSDLYGSGALGGVVRLFRRESAGRLGRVEASLGSQSTPEASAFGRVDAGPWAFDAAGEYFRTDGYIPIESAARGEVDVAATSRHATGDVGVSRRLSTRGRVFLRGALFDEDRGNGTPLQTNATAQRQVSGGLDWSTPQGQIQARGYWSDQDYDQTFSTVAADRNSERLNRTQAVAARATGATVESFWSLGRHRLAAGLELRTVHGDNAEQAITPTSTTPLRVEGRQRTASAFVEDRLPVGSRGSVTLGVRGDTWKNDDAHRTTNGVTSDLASRSEDALSPRGALSYRPARDWTLVASAYRAFRAPTLNELYRSFRVGNVNTQANETLAAERLTGIDLGVRFTPARHVSVRATAFHLEVEDPIANVTLTTTPALIERQRQNLGKTRSQGLELDAEWRATRALTVRAGYLYADATVLAFAVDTSLEGKQLPQVPRHAATLQAQVTSRHGRAWVQARWSDAQFDDDQNQLPLRAFFVLDGRLERTVAGGAAVFAAVENLFDETYDVGRTPLRTIGPPRSFRVGFTVQAPR